MTVLCPPSDLQLLPLMSHQTVTPTRAELQDSGAVALVIKHASCVTLHCCTYSHGEPRAVCPGGSEETDIFNSNPIAEWPMVQVAANCQLPSNCISVTVRWRGQSPNIPCPHRGRSAHAPHSAGDQTFTRSPLTLGHEPWWTHDQCTYFVIILSTIHRLPEYIPEPGESLQRRSRCQHRPASGRVRVSELRGDATVAEEQHRATALVIDGNGHHQLLVPGK